METEENKISDQQISLQSQKNRKIVFSSLLMGFLVVTIGGGILWMKFGPSSASTLSNQPGTALGISTDTDPQHVIQRVGSHMILPSGEAPKVITVANVDQLRKTQPFFNSASNGDMLLVYATKVILYSPISDRIIDIAQIRFDPKMGK